MDYGHYWTYYPDNAKSQGKRVTWLKAIDECRVLVAAWRRENGPDTPSGKGLHVGSSEKEGVLSVYGKAESFHVPTSIKSMQTQIANENCSGNFFFCKTDREGYDVLVTACLAVLAETKLMSVTSDGSYDDWLPGLEFACRVLGRRVANPIPAKKIEPKPVRAVADLEADVARLMCETATLRNQLSAERTSLGRYQNENANLRKEIEEVRRAHGALLAKTDRMRGILNGF